MTVSGERLPEQNPLGEDSMIRRDRWQEIHRLAASHMTIAEVARRLDVDRKTMVRCLRQEAWQPYRRSAPAETLLTPHGALLQEQAPMVGYSARTDRSDGMRGTDATRFYAEEDGWLLALRGSRPRDRGGRRLACGQIDDRWAALAPIRQGVQHAFGAFAHDVARGLTLRCDWGPQCIAQAWIGEGKWLGITRSPSYVGEPQCNGVAERFIRTLKEQCVYLHRFQTLAEARTIIGAFIDCYNQQCLIERLDHRTPAQARAAAQAASAA